METLESLQWLKQNNLFGLAQDISMSLKKIFVPCLAIKNEKILIIGDKGFKGKELSAVLSGAYYLAAESMNIDTKLVLQNVKTRGSIADDNVVSSLDELSEGNVVFLNMSDRLGSIKELGKSFRKLSKKKKFRFVSTPSLGNLKVGSIQHLISAIDVNYKLLQVQHDSLRKLMDEANEIHVKTKAGTDLYFDVNGMNAEAADGNYTLPGKGGNIPAGEVYIAPKGKKVNGTVVIDGSSRNRKNTVLIKKPITLKIEEGSIVDIKGEEEAKLLNDTLDWAANISKHPGSVRRIGEFGIGLNSKAKIIGATIVDEKSLGTAHIGIGSNYWFGGTIYSKIHLDQIFKDPKIYFDGKKLTI